MLQYRLEVEVKRPVLQIRSQPAKVEVRQQRAMFRQHRQQAQMQVKMSKPTFSIDRSNSSWAVNQTPILSLMEQFQKKSVRKGLEAIGRIASEGDRLRQIQHRHQTAANIISDRLVNYSNLNLLVVPKPTMNWDPGYFEIEWDPYEQELEWDMPNTHQIEVQPHQVTIYLDQLPRVNVQFVYIGKMLEKTVKNKR